MFSAKYVACVLLAAVYAPVSFAAPWPATSNFATHRVRQLKGQTVQAFYPPSSYETFGPGVANPLFTTANASPEDAALAFAKSKLGVDSSALSVKSGYSGDVSSHVYLRQQHDGVPFANAVINVAFNSENKVVAFGSSYVKASSIPSSKPTIKVKAAISTAESALGGTYNGIPTTIEYLAKDDGSVALTHVMQIQSEADGTWYEAFVDAHSGELLSVTDFVARASYKVIPITQQDLTGGFQTLTDPQDTIASPKGWQNDGTSATTDTSGNNAIVYIGKTTATTKQSSSGSFVYDQSPSSAPTTANNKNAAAVNAYYIVNSVHDITYRYGFTEKAYNFQNNNLGNGGKAGDRVTVSVQDSAGTDNADFSTPPDGQSGKMRMYLWDETNPERDGALENDIVTHENTHGLTNRMTGGGTGRCLQSKEAGGMGEGWSDAFADWAEKTSAAVPDFTMGTYVLGSGDGIRSHPYSTSATTNPLRYSSIQTLNEVHDIGEVWANLLHNVYAALVGAGGFSATAHTDPSGAAGNVVWLHLFIDALALQPCNPTFASARDAWIQADANRYAGAHKCTLWNAFASRGLGVNAKNYVDDTSVPAGC